MSNYNDKELEQIFEERSTVLEGELARQLVGERHYSRSGWARAAEHAASLDVLRGMLSRAIPLLRKSMENFDDDLEERPMRHSLGSLHREIEVFLEEYAKSQT